jgi:mannose-1-phosphate guanylyltransferase/mannose-6-phosphate isomerase
MTQTSPSIHAVPVILAGGSGTRLWPLSRAAHPKQFLAIGGPDTLFQQAAARLAAVGGAGVAVGAPIVVGNEEHRFTVVDQLRARGTEPAAVLLEPAGRNTAPALTLAALQATEGGDADPVLVVAPADHAVPDLAACTEALRAAVRAADAGAIVVLGIAPVRPDTGYGYIRASGADGSGVREVEAFVEKPDAATAERYLAEGGYLWNSGMFVLKARTWLDALRAFRPDILEATAASWRGVKRDAAFVRPDAALFAAVPSESVDYAVMEPASRARGADGVPPVRLVPLDAGWSDLGAWDAVWQLGAQDADGNATSGDTLLRGTRNTLVHATSRLVGVIGLEDITVVETPDAVLVARRDRSPEVKDLVGSLQAAGRSEATTHRRVHRPWGWYESIDQGPRFQVKRILVKPGASLSLQMHHHRAEHWIVVTGTAEVVNGEQTILLSENQSTYIPLGQRHRLANPGKVPLEIIEVQSGSYLGEDDIVRYQDTYGRVT